MTQPDRGTMVGVLGQWSSGKTEAARTLIRHLGGESQAVFLTDRVLFASQAVHHILELEDSKVVLSVEEDGRQRTVGELVTIWLRPGEELKTVRPDTLDFRVHDDQVLYAWRKRAKVELAHQIRKRSAEGKPIVIEVAFGPNVGPAAEGTYGRTIRDLFARLESAGVEPWRVKWIVFEAGFDIRCQRNEARQANIPVSYFVRYGADGGDLDPGDQARLEKRGIVIRRVPNEHDDTDRFRSDIIAVFEEMLSDTSPASRLDGKRELG